MCPAAGYTWLAMREAIANARLGEEQIRSDRSTKTCGNG